MVGDFGSGSSNIGQPQPSNNVYVIPSSADLLSKILSEENFPEPDQFNEAKKAIKHFWAFASPSIALSNRAEDDIQAEIANFRKQKYKFYRDYPVLAGHPEVTEFMDQLRVLLIGNLLRSFQGWQGELIKTNIAISSSEGMKKKGWF